MDIKEFTKATLTQIIEGVREANNELEASGAFVPSSNLSSIGGKLQYSNKDGSIKILDIASYGGSKSKSFDNSTTSRVKILYPIGPSF